MANAYNPKADDKLDSSFDYEPKAQHTPGPWKFDYAGTASMLMTEKNKPLGFFYNPSIADTETKANARLIAAAPELLEALETFVRWTERHNLNMADLIDGNRCECPVVINARAAIAKARGQQ